MGIIEVFIKVFEEKMLIIFHHEIFLESIDLKLMAKFIGEILFHKSVLALSILVELYIVRFFYLFRRSKGWILKPKTRINVLTNMYPKKV